MTVPAVLAAAGAALAPTTNKACFFIFSGIASAECPSWVQAWGSILAIVATACLFFVQARSERRVRDEVLNDRLMAQAKFALEALKSAGREVYSYTARFKMGSQDDDFDYDTADLDEAIALLREVYLAEMFPDARVALIGVRQSLLKLQQIARDAPGHPIAAYALSGEIALRAATARIDGARRVIRDACPAADVGGDTFQEMHTNLAAGQSNFKN